MKKRNKKGQFKRDKDYFINCIICHKLQQVVECKKLKKFCSPQCYYAGMKGRKFSKQHCQKISLANKGKSTWIKGKRHSEKTKLKMSNTHKKIGTGKWMKNKIGEQANNWKKDEVGKGGVHFWIKKLLGKPKICEICKRKDKENYDWSNKDHKYRRNLEDWQRLCRRCHRLYDYKNNPSKKQKEWTPLEIKSLKLKTKE